MLSKGFSRKGDEIGFRRIYLLLFRCTYVIQRNNFILNYFCNLRTCTSGELFPGAEYQCQWRACPRIKKNAPPFPSLHRLMRHVKEVHISKSIGRVCPPSDRSK